MLKVFSLKNGIKVSTYFIPQMRAVYLGLTVKAGSIFDTKNKSGTAHFMEHILCQAIPSFPDVESLSEFVESLAGNYNASTGSESIDFMASAPFTYLADLLKIGGEIFF